MFSLEIIIPLVLIGKSQASNQNRIANGEDASQADFPYQVSIQALQHSKFTHHCGGSIINSKWILTAAHCINGSSPSDWNIYMGSVLLDSGGTNHTVAQIIVHDDYYNERDPDSKLIIRNDIALMELEEEIQFSKSIQSIDLETENVVKSDDQNLDLMDRDRVADGFLAQRGQFPFQAQIFWRWNTNYRQLICGASIINQRYLLTSAECVYDKNAIDLWVIMGDSRIDYGWVYEVMRIVLRDPYYEPNAPNNIALLQIHGEIYFTTEVAPISYISGIYEPEAVNASGYGWPWYAGDASPALQYATLNTITNAKCAEKWGSRITSDKICTAQTNGRSTCRKDAGGPLSYYGLLIGIIGGTDDECGTGAPNVHTRIAPYSNWITNIISGRYTGACTERI
ncbi:trypsin [Holotrichia oblita]|uniref:Trypsin n=1 Tax=Holotrichia oblita TaxID=644536 RepID=A0ACB9SUP0_HOLOL|nr:trypsin [Holotrichia oblita]